MSDLKKAVVSDSDTTKKSKTRNQLPKREAGAAKRDGAVIYLGPDIKGVANHGDVFRDGYRSLFDGMGERAPLFGNLLFPIGEGTKKYAELRKGGPVARLYEAAENCLKEDVRDE